MIEEVLECGTKWVAGWAIASKLSLALLRHSTLWGFDRSIGSIQY